MAIRARRLTNLVKKKAAARAGATVVARAQAVGDIGPLTEHFFEVLPGDPDPQLPFGNLLCWAASARMIASTQKFRGVLTVPSMEDVVRAGNNGVLANVTLDGPGIQDLYQNRFAPIAGSNIDCVGKSFPIDEPALQAELQSGTPVEMGIDFPPSSGSPQGSKHVSIINGIQAGQYSVFDPMLGKGFFTYQGLRSNYGLGATQVAGQWTSSLGRFSV